MRTIAMSFSVWETIEAACTATGGVLFIGSHLAAFLAPSLFNPVLFVAGTSLLFLPYAARSVINGYYAVKYWYQRIAYWWQGRRRGVVAGAKQLTEDPFEYDEDLGEMEAEEVDYDPDGDE
jgi:hypothetical protein